MNPLKGSRKRNWTENYNFTVIFSQYIGFLRVKKFYFGRFAPYIDKYLDYLETNIILSRLKSLETKYW